jgi:hypothetical protein
MAETIIHKKYLYSFKFPKAIERNQLKIYVINFKAKYLVKLTNGKRAKYTV